LNAIFFGDADIEPRRDDVPIQAEEGFVIVTTSGEIVEFPNAADMAKYALAIDLGRSEAAYAAAVFSSAPFGRVQMSMPI
jgi:hypothetical protein